MPLKQSTNPEVEKAMVPMADLKALCYAMSTVEGFRLNTKDLAPHLGIKAPANVARRIRAIIQPAGFELNDGKISAKGGSGAPNDDDDEAAPPAAPVKGKRANKKRKIEIKEDDIEDEV